MTALDELRDSFLAECSEDDVGIWEVVQAVKRDNADIDAATTQYLTLDLIRSLLETGAIQAGVFAPEDQGWKFQPWLVEPSQAVERIRKEWDALGREPNIGDVAFLTANCRV